MHLNSQSIVFPQHPTGRHLLLYTMQPATDDNCAHHIYPRGRKQFAVLVDWLPGSSMLLVPCAFCLLMPTFWASVDGSIVNAFQIVLLFAAFYALIMSVELDLNDRVVLVVWFRLTELEIQGKTFDQLMYKTIK